MADPVSAMAMVSVGSSVFGGINSAQGAQTAAQGALAVGKGQQDMFNYQAGVAQINQKISENNADYALAAGESNAQISGIKTSSTIASERAGQGAGGLDVNTGSNADVRASTADIGAYDQGVIRNQAAREAYGYTVQGWQYGQQAVVDQMAGKNAMTAAQVQSQAEITKGNASLISAAGGVSDKWMSFKQQGVL